MVENRKQDTETGIRDNQSQYELTLAEFPVFLLSKGGTGNTQMKCIEYHDTIRGKDGVPVSREWMVYPDGKYGFGTVSTFDTFFDLFQIWQEDSFMHQYIRFGSPYQIAKRRGQAAHSGKNHHRIIRDLRCLTGITIDAKNAYWDNEVRAYVDATFHLFDYLRLYKEEAAGASDLPYGSIKASDALYDSVRKNSMLLADFDPEFFYSLTPLEKRLALYLTKVFRSQTEHKRNLLELARQMPINAKRTDHLKESLKRACTGLTKKGFKLLKDVTFEKNGHGEIIVFKRKGRPKGRPPQRTERAVKVMAWREPAEVQLLVEDILDV